jgi:glycosyltransferase involved in cell wall biosynthesis
MLKNPSKDPPKKVSVVMCTYNGALYVEEQLNSILQQTYPLLELLVFDDCSTDNTIEIIKAVASGNSIIKLHQNKNNIGFTKNFEQALKGASGDIIAISDQDDIWMKTKIEEMIKAWKQECPLIYCESKLFFDAIPTDPKPHPKWRRFEGTEGRKIFLQNSISGHATLIKKELLQLIFPFEAGVMYDWWIGVVAAYNGGVQYYPKVLVLQRGHENNVTINRTNLEKNEKEEQPAYKKHVIKHLEKFAKTPNLPLDHISFATKFSRSLEESLKKNFHFGLFFFLLQNRKLLFDYKKRMIGIFSHIKHSYRKSFR